ncbi:MAG TPA: pyridoxal-phosphate dependent enzyme [Nordella sp.]|nr:pyridoxal-phosphate dependent enzyme [Nordella sp.]
MQHAAGKSWTGDEPLTLPTLPSIDAAARRLAPYLQQTPLIPSAALSHLLGADVWVKVETVSPVASFKARGALNHLILAQATGQFETAVTSSTGNHGQGVARAAALLGLRADIFLPLGSVSVKKRMIELLGGTVHEIGSDIDAAKDHAREFAADNKAIFVDDGESLAMMDGAGTVGLEVAAQCPDLARVYVPMGSGVLATGVATAVKGLIPHAEVIAVQSTGAPAMTESFHARRPIERPITTFADGIVCRVPALRALKGIVERVDDCRLVADEAILGAMHTMLLWGHLLVEPGSASVLARAYEDRREIAGKRIVLIATGANVDRELISRALSAPALGAT